MNSLMKLHKGGNMTKLLKEIRDLLKEILSELKQQKEPTEVTVDSEKRSYTSIFYILTDKKIPPSKQDKGWSNLLPEPKKCMFLWSYVNHYDSNSDLTTESDICLLTNFDRIGD